MLHYQQMAFSNIQHKPDANSSSIVDIIVAGTGSLRNIIPGSIWMADRLWNTKQLGAHSGWEMSTNAGSQNVHSLDCYGNVCHSADILRTTLLWSL